jgi:hypothetical protein
MEKKDTSMATSLDDVPIYASDIKMSCTDHLYLHSHILEMLLNIVIAGIEALSRNTFCMTVS